MILSQSNYNILTAALVAIFGASPHLALSNNPDKLEAAAIESRHILAEYGEFDLTNTNELWAQNKIVSGDIYTPHLCVPNRLCSKDVNISGNLCIAGKFIHHNPFTAYVILDKNVYYNTGSSLPLNDIISDYNGDYSIINNCYNVPQDGLYTLNLNAYFICSTDNKKSPQFALASVRDDASANILAYSISPIIHSWNQQLCSQTATIFLKKDQKISGSISLLEISSTSDLIETQDTVELLKDTHFSICYLHEATTITPECCHCSTCDDYCDNTCPPCNTSPNTSPNISPCQH